MSTVYLIHFSSPIGTEKHQAQHYVGFAEDLRKRLTEHAMGTRAGGARLLEVCNERKVEWPLARVWEGGDRQLERRLKNFNGSEHFCPSCRGDGAYERAHFGNATWREPGALEISRDEHKRTPALDESHGFSRGGRR